MVWELPLPTHPVPGAALAALQQTAHVSLDIRVHASMMIGIIDGKERYGLKKKKTLSSRKCSGDSSLLSPTPHPPQQEVPYIVEPVLLPFRCLSSPGQPSHLGMILTLCCLPPPLDALSSYPKTWSLPIADSPPRCLSVFSSLVYYPRINYGASRD